MQLALPTLLAALAVGQNPRACYETTNFMVYADTAESAKRIGDAAENYRVQLAQLWLGRKMDDFEHPCRIDVTTAERPGGVTEITYGDRRVLFHRVNVQGSLDRVLKGPLPHELTHLLLAHHFGFRLPRWVDEGAAILSENEAQRAAHGKAFRHILDKRQQYPLREFFGIQEYPSDVGPIYAQGHSVCGFLVAAKGHQAFLRFVREGLERSWDEAVNDRYGYKDVEQLEKAWLDWAGRQSETLPAPTRMGGWHRTPLVLRLTPTAL